MRPVNGSFESCVLPWFGKVLSAAMFCWLLCQPVAGYAQQRPLKNASTKVAVKKRVATKRSATKSGWVSPRELVEQLGVLKTIPVTQLWAEETLQLIKKLVDEKNIRSYKSELLLGSMEQQATQLDQIVAIIAQRFPDLPASQSLSSKLRRLRYDLTKRLAIWNALQATPVVARTASGQSLSQAKARQPFTLASTEQISFDHFDEGWKSYLRLNQVEKEARSLKPDPKLQKEAAREALFRLYAPTLNASQNQYLQQMFDPAAADWLKDAASGPVDYYQLIRAMEKYESKPSGIASHYINDQFQNLLWAPDAASQAAAEQIQTHYRNANVRLAISRRMLNRLIPPSPSVDQPVHERVLGADVNGHSQIQNALSVELIPDPTRFHLELKTLGRVDSDTVARKSGFAIRNSGLAKFQARKRFAIDRSGNLDGQRSTAHAHARQRTIDIRSNLDSLPIVNWIARRIAQKQISEQAPEANLILEEKVQDSAIEQLEQGVTEKVAMAQALLKMKLLEPLTAMDLNPEALQVATTQQRLVMRYRLAGLDQMAANSPRPSDSENDYLGVQLHQSLLNNMIERIDIQSQSFTPETLLNHLADVLGFDPNVAGDDIKQDATFVFAKYDPIRIDLDDRVVRIELNLRSLQVGKGKVWRNITITSIYRPEIIGTQIRLVQDEPIAVKGRRFRLGDQIAVRTIFTVLLPKELAVPVVPPQLQNNMNGYALQIKELDIADGWVGVTFDEVPISYYNPQPVEYRQSYLHNTPQY